MPPGPWVGLASPLGVGWGPRGQPGPRAHWDHVQDLNSAITYRVTNNSNFRMDGEAVLTAAPLVQAGVFYAEVRSCAPEGRGPGGTEEGQSPFAP